MSLFSARPVDTMLRCKRAAWSCAWSIRAPFVGFSRSFSTTTSRTAGDDHDGLVMRPLEPEQPDRETLALGPGETGLRSEEEVETIVAAGKVNEATDSEGTTSMQPQPRTRSPKKDKRIGSLRRRVAIKVTGDIPFEQLPYQCFQEARKILMADRADKISRIKTEMAKVRRLEAQDPSVFRAGEYHKQKRLKSLRQHIEKLKILADINDPVVKRRFEDGLADMNKPIYRYLAKRKWESMDYKIIQQRLDQFYIVPDVLPKFRPVIDVSMWYRGYKQPPGQILDSAMTEVPPVLRMQVFDPGERLLTIVVVDSDVPDAENDRYGRRLHFLATNIPWDPTQRILALVQIPGALEPGAPPPLHSGLIPNRPTPAAAAADVAVPWLPPFGQKGAPYHRLSIFVLRQDKRLDAGELARLYGGGTMKAENQEGEDPVAMTAERRFGRRNGFQLWPMMSKYGLTGVGFNLLRTKWDAHTETVMARHNIPGADIEFRRKRVHSLKTPRKARGWEAKRQGPKYKHVWKYSKRIARTGGG